MKTYIVPMVPLALIACLVLVMAASFWSDVRAEETDAAVTTTTTSSDVTTIDESVTTDTTEGVSFLPTEDVAVTEEATTEAPIAPEPTDATDATNTTDATDATESTDDVSSDIIPTDVVEASDVPAAVLSTDKDDYHPGTTATIFGSFFAPLQNFVLKIFGSDENDQNYTEQTATVTTDDAGTFSFQYLLDMIYRPFYRVAVTEPEAIPDTAPVAETYFRDSSIGAYDQCSNDLGTGYTSGNTGCRWTNGNIQANNSRYFEGDSTVQRLWIEGYAPGSSHTVTFQYGTTKAGKHAYDYLTTWDASENWVTVADRCEDITGCTTAAETQTVMQNDPNVTDTIEPAASGRKFTVRGGTIASSTIPFIASGTTTSDSETSVTVNFKVATSGSMCATKSNVTSCGIAIWFGAHVAKGAEWTSFNGSTGAGSITGSPYHVALDKEDGSSVGQRDNQMQSAAILPPAATGVITIIKDTVPDDAQDFAFTASGTGLSNFSLDDDANATLSNTKTFSALADGTYSVTEAAATGFDLTNLVCSDLSGGTTVNLGTRNASINLTGGETVTCTYTNTKKGHLIVDKVTIPAADPTVFSILAAGNGTITNGGTSTVTDATNKDYEVTPGTYSVTETVPAGWAQTGNTCTGVVVAAGATANCTITNTKVTKLTLLKDVVNNNGGGALDTAWTLSATGPTNISGIEGNAAVTNATVAAGAYTLGETGGPSGYSASLYSCVKTGGQPVVSNSLTLAAGDTATCTITNDDIAPQLTVIKHVINDNGGNDVASSFTMNVTATNPSNASFAGAENPGTTITLDAGTYSVDEGVHTGYTKSIGANCSGTIAVGESKTCTITNNDDLAHITLTKVVTNNSGGNAGANDFGLTIGGNQATSGQTYDVNSNTTHALNEAGLAGYSFVSLTGDAKCPAVLGGTVSLAEGESVACTITNDDQPATLIVKKIVINDNGGTGEADDFSFIVNAGAGTPFESDGQNDMTVNAGTYSVVEPSVAGYARTYDNCSNLQIPNGGTATCTITNNDIAPVLHLRKIIVNDNGGTKTAADFTLTADGTTTNDITGTSPVDSGAGLLADTFALSEVPVAGYAASAWVCVGGTQNGANITLGIGQSATCTITNDDIAPKLTVTKVVINHGGTKVAADFPLFVASSSVTSGVQNTYNVGTYIVSENGSPDYTETISGDCHPAIGQVVLALGDVKACTITNEEKLSDITVKKVVINHGGTKIAADFGPYKVDTTTVTLDAATTFDSGSHTVTEVPDADYTQTFSGDCDAEGVVVLGSNEHKTCTITNEEKPATIVVHKVVVNHGLTNDATHFAPYKVGSTTVTLDAVTGINSGTYTVSELTDANYTASFSGDCNAQGSVTVTPGSAKSCTITNTEIPTHLKVVKVVINHGLTNDKTHFAPYKIDTTTVTEGASNVVDSGTHAVSETTDANYTQTFSENCLAGSITLLPGDDATCTITNEEKLSDITVHKVVINHGGTKTAADFAPYNVDTTTVTLDAATTFDSGNHTVTEVPHADYTATFSGDCDANGAVVLGSNEHKTCTITNEEKPAKLVVTKVVINDNGGTKVVADFPLFVGTTSVTSGATSTFDSGSYIVSETGDAGYNAVISGDCNPATGAVTLVPGVTKQCTITNNDKPAHLIVIKHVDNGLTGATGVASDFTTTISGVTTATPVATGAEAPGIDNTLTTVGAYTVTEGVHTGYSMSASADCDATIALGETKTCTITNTAIAPKLTVIKIVDNGTTGATTDASAFQMMVDAGNVPQNVAQTETVGSHIVTESGPAGYTAAFSGDCNASGTVSLALADDKTCTITNTAIAPKLTLVKIVQNDNGGTKVIADFPLSIDATGVTSGVKNVTTVGAHTASEISDPGYTASAWADDCAADGSITLALADDKICTITNDDKPGHLIVHKITNPTDTTTAFSITATGGTIVSPAATQPIVGGGAVDYTVNKGTYAATEATLAGWDETANTCSGVVINNGETKECTITNTKKGHLIVDKVTVPALDLTSFSISATGTGSITGSGAATVTDATNKDYEVTPGTYGATETVPTGWDQTSNTCTGVVIAAGETKTCTITNTKRAKVTIVKDAQPQDTQDFAFSGTLGAFTLDDDSGVVDPITGEELNEFSNTKTVENVVPGTLAITEAQANQYWKLKGATCVLTGSTTVASSSLVGNTLSVTAAPGADITCTFVNEKMSPTRTQGFWQTHTAFTTTAFGTTNPMKIGTNATKISTAGQLFGAWYSSIPKKTNNQQRSALDKARMQLLQQLVTAKLNCQKFGCTGSVQTLINTADTAYQTGTAAQIIASAAILDAYNNSGDTIIVGNTGKATPKVSESTALKTYWDILP